jgi:N-acetyl-gamma-glutamyl-phosphate reductase
MDRPPELRSLIPDLPKGSGLKLENFRFGKVVAESDVVFITLPHTEAMEIGSKLYQKGKIVIDLSADFRLRDARIYERWYHVKHRSRNLLRRAVYGLPEIFREELREANLIANPGCYPTGAILGLKPLLEWKLIENDSIVIDSKSGVSGAGRSPSETNVFGEVNENFKAYKVNRHQHMPEIQWVLDQVAGEKVGFSFVPHLLPVERGILSTIYAKKRPSVKVGRILKAFQKVYEKEPFVRVKRDSTFPSLRDVQHTNFCDIGVWTDPSSDRVIVISAIDNLLKGASGQAVQNMNIRCGFPEETALI